MRLAWLLIVGVVFTGCSKDGPTVTGLTNNNTFLADPSGSEPDAMPTGDDTDTGGTEDATSVGTTESSPTTAGPTGPDDTSSSSNPTNDPDTTDPTNDPDTTDPTNDPDTTDPTNDPDTTDPTNDPDTTDPTNDPSTTDTGELPDTVDEGIYFWCEKFVECYPNGFYADVTDCYISQSTTTDSIIGSASNKSACEAALINHYICAEEGLCRNMNAEDCDYSLIDNACA